MMSLWKTRNIILVTIHNSFEIQRKKLNISLSFNQFRVLFNEINVVTDFLLLKSNKKSLKIWLENVQLKTSINLRVSFFAQTVTIKPQIITQHLPMNIHWMTKNHKFHSRFRPTIIAKLRLSSEQVLIEYQLTGALMALHLTLEILNLT